MTTLTGAVERIVYHSADSGFTVARFHLDTPSGRGRDSITIVGPLPTVCVGEMLRVTGEWETHSVHGRNLRIHTFEPQLPDTADGIERYLASGVVRGVGPVTARRIVETFGADTMRIIDQEPEMLEQVAGISAKRCRVIAESWTEQKHVRAIMMFLQEHEVSAALASRLFAAYGAAAVDRVREDPYNLAHDIHGIGFKTADGLARKLGVSRQSVSRYVAGLRHVLSEATEDGHVYLLRGELLDRASHLLAAERAVLEPALLELFRRDIGVLEGDAVYLSPFHTAEAGAARKLRTLQSTPSSRTLGRKDDIRRAIMEAGASHGLELAELQERAAEQALEQKVSILTGGPGTGKTSTLRTIISALESLEITYCLCAPTGRAAKRAAEATGRRASTIHRLLEFQPAAATFAFDHTRPLPYDFVVVDEVSMVDTLLFYHLLKAIPPESHLLLVGDADQLPSVGPGNVLRDILESAAVPSITLTHLFRQVRGSQIVLAAHGIRQGTIPEILNRADDDLFFVRAESEDHVVSAIESLVANRIPNRYSLHPIEDIQVLSPMHSGPAGVSGLNRSLQALLNQSGQGTTELRRGDRIFREGDKVMQTRNNYDKEIYNGDAGIVVEVDAVDQALMVEFSSPDGPVLTPYESSELDELVLAYAVSVHKAQGSEYPCVVMPLITRHYMLLQRNVLYTAITRARRLCVLVGSTRALRIAVESDRQNVRRTGLTERLQGLPDGAAHVALV